MNDYYKMIYVYLSQDLPVQYKNYLRFDGADIMFVIPGNENFNSMFNRISNATENYINEIRERKMDIKFTVWKSTQSRDFFIYK
jgi:hypothetical protein